MWLQSWGYRHRNHRGKLIAQTQYQLDQNKPLKVLSQAEIEIFQEISSSSSNTNIKPRLKRGDWIVDHQMKNSFGALGKFFILNLKFKFFLFTIKAITKKKTNIDPELIAIE